MKTKLTTLALSLVTALALAHSGVELGPNGGRILEFSKNETLHGEVTVKGGQFHIALLDKDLKPVTLADEVLTATGGTREKPVKLPVTKTDKGFTLPLVKPGQWLILQFKAMANARPVTARMEYNTDNCEGCDKAEWLCQCKPDGTKK